MCVCSGTQSDSKPRSSSSRANGAGCMESAVKNITAPIFMVVSPGWRLKAILAMHPGGKHANRREIPLHRQHGCGEGEGGPVQRGLRQGACAAALQGAGRARRAGDEERGGC